VSESPRGIYDMDDLAPAAYLTFTRFVRQGFHNSQGVNAGSARPVKDVLVCDEKFRPDIAYYYSIQPG